jgi:hypothetical protein
VQKTLKQEPRNPGYFIRSLISLCKLQNFQSLEKRQEKNVAGARAMVERHES